MLHFRATEPFDIFTRRFIHDVSDGCDRDIVLSGTGALHDVATNLNWDSYGPSEIFALANRPDAARATILYLYWHNCAGYFLQYASRADVRDFELEGYDLDQALEQLYRSKSDLGDGIGYDPRSDDGCDWTTVYADKPQRRAAPAHMLVTVPGALRPRLGDTDWHGRPPTTAEQAAITESVARGRAVLPGLASDAKGREVVVAIAAAMRGPTPVNDDLAWLWLDQLGWEWQCADNQTDGVLFGACRGAVSMVVPDIVRNTLRAGVDPSRTLDFFDLIVQPRTFDTDCEVENLIKNEFPFAYVNPMGFDYSWP